MVRAYKSVAEEDRSMVVEKYVVVYSNTIRIKRVLFFVSAISCYSPKFLYKFLYKFFHCF